MDSIVVDRIRADFREMPGLHLTLRQAERLFGLEPEECRAALDALVKEAHKHKQLTMRKENFARTVWQTIG